MENWWEFQKGAGCPAAEAHVSMPVIFHNPAKVLARGHWPGEVNALRKKLANNTKRAEGGYASRKVIEAVGIEIAASIEKLLQKNWAILVANVSGPICALMKAHIIAVAGGKAHPPAIEQACFRRYAWDVLAPRKCSSPMCRHSWNG